MKLIKVLFVVLVIILFYVRYFTTTGQEMKEFFEEDWRHSITVVCYGVSMYLIGLYYGKTK